MKRLMKKLMAGAMAGIMAFSLIPSAFALVPTTSESSESDYQVGSETGTVSSEGKMDASIVKVVLPTGNVGGYFNMALDPHELFSATDAKRFETAGGNYVEGYSYAKDFNGDKLFFYNLNEEGAQAVSGTDTGDFFAGANASETPTDGSKWRGYKASQFTNSGSPNFDTASHNQTLPAYEKVEKDTVYFKQGGFYTTASHKARVESLVDSNGNYLDDPTQITTANPGDFGYTQVASTLEYTRMVVDKVVYLGELSTGKFVFFTDGSDATKAAASLIDGGYPSNMVKADVASGFTAQQDAIDAANAAGYTALTRLNSVVSDTVTYAAYVTYKVDESSTSYYLFTDDAGSGKAQVYQNNAPATAEAPGTNPAVPDTGDANGLKSLLGGSSGVALKDAVVAALKDGYILTSETGTSTSVVSNFTGKTYYVLKKAQTESVWYQAGDLKKLNANKDGLVALASTDALYHSSDLITMLSQLTGETYPVSHVPYERDKDADVTVNGSSTDNSISSTALNAKGETELVYLAYTGKKYSYGFWYENKSDSGQNRLLTRTGTAIQYRPDGATQDQGITELSQATGNGWTKYLVDKVVFSGESKHLQVINKGSVDVGVSLKATVDKNGKKFYFTSDPTFAGVGDTDEAKTADAAKAKMYLTLNGAGQSVVVADPATDSQGNSLIGLPEFKITQFTAGGVEYEVIKSVTVAYDNGAEEDARKIVNDALVPSGSQTGSRDYTLSYTNSSASDGTITDAINVTGSTGSYGSGMSGQWNGGSALEGGASDRTGSFVISNSAGEVLRITIVFDGALLRSLVADGVVTAANQITATVSLTKWEDLASASIKTAVAKLDGAYDSDYTLDKGYTMSLNKAYKDDNQPFNVVDFYLAGNINGVDAWDKIESTAGANGIQIKVLWDVHKYKAANDGAIPEAADPTVRVLKEAEAVNDEVKLYVDFGSGANRKYKVAQMLYVKENETADAKAVAVTTGEGTVRVHGNYVYITAINAVYTGSNWRLQFVDADGKNPKEVSFQLAAETDG